MGSALSHISVTGGGASFCVLHVDPTEPIGTAPLSDPTVRNGSVRSVRLLLKPQTAHLKTQVTSPVAAAPSTRGHFCRDTSLEQNPGPSWTDWPGSSSLEKPESSGCRMRAHSWRSKGVKITKSCKKSK
ncbi:hypothetical protein J1605_022595 [Eschrichtius robustus]|uniref:Uncharacterized protein n=1 Tax=Eschrichtius robustus TaxID=9764 RepID=A0AB34H8P2_ESCRO|nr:hypothetical protein J1605_022595 [Eschrichtius robustus]